MVTVWVKHINNNPTKPKGVTYFIEHVTIDCRMSEVQALSRTEYNSDNEAISDVTYQLPNWLNVVPDSEGEAIVTKICDDVSPR